MPRDTRPPNIAQVAETLAHIDWLPPAAGRAARAGLLSEADVERYRQIFERQEAGDWDAADALIATLSDRRLMGHVLAQRYLHPTAYRSRYDELHAWLQQYADHPDAPRIYRLAQRRRKAGDAPPPAPATPPPIAGSLGSAGFAQGLDVRPPSRLQRSADRAEVRQAGEVLERIARHLRRGAPAAALEALNSSDLAHALSPLEYDALRAEIAAGFFFAGNHRQALALAHASASRSGDALPLAHWIGGLAAWRLGQLERAGRHFKALAGLADVSPWDASAGAYWAARVHLRQRRPSEHLHWLAQAASHPRTFYGLIARRALGIEDAFRFEVPELTGERLRLLAQLPAGRRALGLLQIGQRERAEQELLRVPLQRDQGLHEALLALAETAGLPGLALRLGSAVAAPDGSYYDAALYPVPPWTPREGFLIDRALLYALMRQESRFEPSARSHAGASGLMQLMPATAAYVADLMAAAAPAEVLSGFDVRNRAALFHPEFNLTLGQRYVRYLLDHPEVKGDLVKAVIAYNAGPGNLAKWRRQIGDDDPLLFIESIPSRETRNFIEQVLTNFWIYRKRMGQDAPSLDALAAHQWPGYMPLDDVLQVAEDGAH